MTWMETQGLDLLCQNSPAGAAIMTVDMAAFPESEGSFDNITVQQIVKELLLTAPSTQAIVTPAGGPSTFVFRTREGSLGVLEIAGARTGPGPLEIRYKLVANTVRDALAVQVANMGLLPELEKNADRLATATDPAEIAAAARTLVRASAAFDQTMKGTSIPPLFLRRLDSAIRILAEHVDDPDVSKLKERAADVRDAVSKVKERLTQMSQDTHHDGGPLP
jgi:hypothetical protein